MEDAFLLRYVVGKGMLRQISRGVAHGKSEAPNSFLLAFGGTARRDRATWLRPYVVRSRGDCAIDVKMILLEIAALPTT